MDPVQQPSAPTPVKTVLVVEDDVFLLNAYQLKLQREGYTVVTAENGQVGLEKLATVKPDAIVLDLMMPVMDGLTMLTQLKANPATAMIPVIVATNNTAEDVAQKAKALGATDFLLKVETGVADIAAKVGNVIQKPVSPTL